MEAFIVFLVIAAIQMLAAYAKQKKTAKKQLPQSQTHLKKKNLSLNLNQH